MTYPVLCTPKHIDGTTVTLNAFDLDVWLDMPLCPCLCLSPLSLSPATELSMARGFENHLISPISGMELMSKWMN